MSPLSTRILNKGRMRYGRLGIQPIDGINETTNWVHHFPHWAKFSLFYAKEFHFVHPCA
jgi:hypothetical protein